MERRSFLMAGAALLAGFIPFNRTERIGLIHKIIDYSDSDADSFGVIFRRAIRCDEIPAHCVKEAYMLSNGDLQVYVWATDSFLKEIKPSFIKRAVIRVIGCYDKDQHSMKPHQEYVGIIPRGGWKVVQYDGTGKELRTLTYRNFQ
jgi:hypothetical protein